LTVALAPEAPEQAGRSLTFTRVIDLSTGLIDGAGHERTPPKVVHKGHEKGAEWFVGEFGLASADELKVSGGLGPASELVTSVTHAGTHVDAPWHYHPTSEGRPAKTIEECPVEWFFSDGVVLDMRHKKPGDRITAEDVQGELRRIEYVLKPLDIVLIMTGCDERLGSADYFEQPGMTREATIWLADQGIKVMGVDMWGFDRSMHDMAKSYKETGDPDGLWEAHYAGIDREYCQIEKLVHLDQIPRPWGFSVAAFPIKIENASAGWCRPVAFV
jgi:kynurenine formamidase